MLPGDQNCVVHIYSHPHQINGQTTADPPPPPLPAHTDHWTALGSVKIAFDRHLKIGSTDLPMLRAPPQRPHPRKASYHHTYYF